MHLLRSQDVAPQCGHQWVEQIVHLLDPASHRRAVDLHTLTCVDAALPVQRQMVAILVHHHVRKQAGARHAAADRRRGAAVWKII